MGVGRMKSVFGRVGVLVTTTLLATAGVVAMPAVAHADTLVGCDTPGLVAAITAANTAGSGTLDLTAGCVYKLTAADPGGHGLPSILASVTIHGNGATIERIATAPQFGLFFNFGSLVIDHLTLTGGNTPNDGGAIDSDGSVTLTDSIVSGNSATVFGGGIFANAGTYTISGSTISGNTASEGAGIFNDGGTETITNSTISNNIGEEGILNYANTNTITNSTISNNNIGIRNSFEFGGTLTVASSILSANTAGGNCYLDQGPFTSGGYNLDTDGTCALTSPTDLNKVDPQLGPLQGNGGPTETLAPAATSPVIDAIPKGTNGCGSTITSDQRGVRRPQGSGCDIGAYETGDVAMQSLKAKPKSVASGANVTYTATVVNAGAVDATGVTVTDTLPTGVSFVSATSSLGSCSFATPTPTCALGQFPAATTATVTITAKVTAAAGKKLRDKATVGATTGDTILTNDTKTAKITVT